MRADLVDQLYRTHHAGVLSHLRYRYPGIPAATCEDAAAVAFERLMRKPDDWCDPDHVGGWLYAVLACPSSAALPPSGRTPGSRPGRVHSRRWRGPQIHDPLTREVLMDLHQLADAYQARANDATDERARYALENAADKIRLAA